MQSEVGDESNVQKVIQVEETETEATENADGGWPLSAESQRTHGTYVLSLSSLHTLHQTQQQQAAKGL
jgi:hypothetical protein